MDMADDDTLRTQNMNDPDTVRTVDLKQAGDANTYRTMGDTTDRSMGLTDAYSTTGTGEGGTERLAVNENNNPRRSRNKDNNNNNNAGISNINVKQTGDNSMVSPLFTPASKNDQNTEFNLLKFDELEV